MIFAKIDTEGNLITGKNPLKISTDGNTYEIFNPKAEHYIEAGYKELIEDEYPQDSDKYFVLQYVEEDSIIRGKWVESETPAEPPVEVASPLIILSKDIHSVQTELTDAQLALCELYEMMIG